MCEISIKLPAMLDQNPPHTFDNSENTDYNKKRSQSLTLSQLSRSEQKSKDNDMGNKKHGTRKKNLSRGCHSNWCDAEEDAYSSETKHQVFKMQFKYFIFNNH